MLKKTLAITGVSAALIAGCAFPAAAAPADFTGGYVYVGTDYDFTYWDLDTDGGISHSGIVHDDDADGQYDAGDDYEFDRVWCGTSGGLELDGNGFSSDATEQIDTDSNGDQVVTGAMANWRGLSATAEFRAYAEGDLLRTTYVLTNNTNSAITVTPSTTDDTSDSSGEGTTMSGDSTFELTDLWWTQYSTAYLSENWWDTSDHFPSVVFGRYYGSVGSVTLTSDTAFDPFADTYDDVVFGDVTIQPGASYQFVFFYQMLSFDQSAGYGAATDAAALAVSNHAADEFGGTNPALSGRLARGLDLTIASNFAPATTPDLASTGFDASGLGLAGAVLALAGAAVIVRRRKATR